MSQSPPPGPTIPEIPDHLSVDSGEYFAQGRRWARLMFETPIIERSYLLLFLSIIFIIFILTFSSLTSLFPLSQPMRMVFTNDDSGFDYPRVMRIARKDEPLQQSVARYIAEQYVIAHENYEYDRTLIDQRYRFVYNQSSPEVFQNYRRSLSVNNPQSPLNILEQDGKRVVNNIHGRIVEESANDGIVSMTIEVFYSEGIAKRTIDFTRKKATLHITMHEITIHKPSKSVYQYNPSTKEFEPLQGRILFRVNSYKAEPVQPTTAQKN